jgi:glycerol-3-phosphate dehydrogenase
MERNLASMAHRPYDLLVIGGGIYGACVAWDGVLRGLRVALVERADYGGGTSANSLKTLHGGLRYLQEANLPLMRLMIRERNAWMRMAPHLVRPLPFLLPTGGKASQHRLIMRAALTVNDIMSADRNQGIAPELRLPHGRSLSRAETLEYLPGLEGSPVSGGALWYDAQILDTEQLLRTIVAAAVQHGADAANYAAVAGFLQNGRRVHGASIIDRLSGKQYEVEARLVVNCAGAWSDELLSLVKGGVAAPIFRLSTALNLVTRQIVRDVAVGLPSRWQGQSRTLFVAPWRDWSLIGTWHAHYAGSTPQYQWSEQTIAECLAEVNAAYPGAHLEREDVRQVHMGYLPAEPRRGDAVRLVRKSMVLDHAARDGVEGLVSAVGVKYTTARHTAEQVVDLALHKLRRPFTACRTAHTQLYTAPSGEPLPVAAAQSTTQKSAGSGKLTAEKASEGLANANGRLKSQRRGRANSK